MANLPPRGLRIGMPVTVYRVGGEASTGKLKEWGDDGSVTLYTPSVRENVHIPAARIDEVRWDKSEEDEG